MPDQSSPNNDPPSQEGNLAQQLPPQNQVAAPIFTNWLEVLSFLLRTKHGLLLISILIIVVGAIVSFSLYITRPDQIEITTKAGNITLKRGNKQDAILLLNPVGGKNTPWVSTGIMVKANDKVTITASGRVNTSLKRVVKAAQTDEKLESPWVSPEGSDPDEDLPRDRIKSTVMPSANGAYYGYGMLIAAIKDSTKQIKNIENIGENKEFTIKTDGELVLTVNDIWLSSDMKDVYAPPFNDDNFRYYLSLAALKSEDSNSWSEKMKREKAHQEYQNRLRAWNYIADNKNCNVWYNDNIGAFSVSVSGNK
ncbi:hypothetical protein [Nostoc sp. TCL240-02]|uniref:hypothetical protein n=1 Tax=Nostoc sp. TCL240-02 TaxID=2572090 RepID=UPI00157F9857|nr:hypothetical protein [Nostoc sp. TCL240-02]QKQ74781.1 hypothetical protein FBB35_16890 [Nostoc sp. TCL240-02]